MSTIAILIVSALCGVAFGYAAQRGSICVISGIETLLAGRSSRVFLSFFRCSLWVVVVTLPLAWVIPGEQLGGIAAPTLATIIGGLLFGIGAAVNGGCSFGTLIRLGAGDASFAATLVGLGLGIVVQGYVPMVGPVHDPIGPSPFEAPTVIGGAVLAIAAGLFAREALAQYRLGRSSGRWPCERAVLLMGVAGGMLYALHGTWAYTLAIERGLATMQAGGIPNLDLALIFLACLGGAAIAAGQLHRFRLTLNVRDIPKHLLGGTIMGAGAGLVPGGNDALVLHAFPALSPHAPVAYVALVIGAVLALDIGRRLRGRP